MEATPFLSRGQTVCTRIPQRDTRPEATPFPSLFAFSRADRAELGSFYDEIFDRIETNNPRLRIFEDRLPVREETRACLDALFERLPDPERRPPLFGVPFGVKGVFRVEGREIRCGSLLPADLFRGREAAAVSALRAAGALPLGITATTEFASSEPAATCNPRNPEHTPGGSSSGSAAGVAAGFFPLATGTQTIGSIIRPASYCGITGFKASGGRVPTEGLVYFSRTFDHAGFFCATPHEIEEVMRAILPDWKPECAPAKIRLGVPVGPYLDQADADNVARMREELAPACAAGGPLVLKDVPCLEDIAAVNACHQDAVAAELAEEHRDRFERFEALYRPGTARQIRYGRDAGAAAAAAGAQSRLRLRVALHEVLRAHKLHALICPSSVSEADKGLLGTGDPVMNLPWTHAGLPVLGLPLGRGASGLPLGRQLTGAFGADEALLAVGKKLYEIVENRRRIQSCLS
jgi:Asp-tRNA(Asn)/Glu-tRNA(Gln) amidotransferase A subunit family amidase